MLDAEDVAGSELLEVEARYVSASGELVTTTVGALDGVEVVRGLPVRRISSHAGQRHYPGSFWSATTGAHVDYESRLELDRLWLADFDPAVAWMASQPLWLCGSDGAARRRHAPDLLLQGRDGSFTVVDVKPAEFAVRPEVAAVFAWTGRLCAAAGWRYEVWSGAPAVVLDNVRTLASARRADLVDPDASATVLDVVSSEMSISAVMAAASPPVPRSLALSGLMWLLWSGQLAADLEQPLSGDSLVLRPEGSR
ncbi:TnsA-like heteromeric transposase endonuclease subunit [Pseudokineococcus basanitobsidens]|uniref:TnsA-like heteromeric transposase endonuclease subunit n=1 Tax=Pseudokineococcus basanitobsidens TaxID=1926649 RepID=A0ABU8RPM2_9ACTN